MYDDLEKNKEAPKEPDDASAGRKFKKDEPNMPEQPGSRIPVVQMVALNAARLAGRSSNDDFSRHGRNQPQEDAGEEGCSSQR